jgi:hypothetical protein
MAQELEHGNIVDDGKLLRYLTKCSCEVSDMVRIKKSDVWKATHATDAQQHQEFDRGKIEMALVRAGARGAIVKEIAATVKPSEGMTTDDIDRTVVQELEKRDPETAKYWKKKRDYNRSRFKK